MNEGGMGYFLACFPLNLVSFCCLENLKKNHILLLVGRFEVPAMEKKSFLFSFIFLKDTQAMSKEALSQVSPLQPIEREGKMINQFGGKLRDN